MFQRSENASALGKACFFIPFKFPELDKPDIMGMADITKDAPTFSLARVHCAFQTAHFGNMALGKACFGAMETQKTLDRRKNLPEMMQFNNWVELKQVHKDKLLINPAPTDPEKESETEADGACTQAPGLALCIKTADCQPILLAHKNGSAIAALHVGWRGNAIEFIQSGVAKFCAAYGFEPKDILAVRGPSLGPSEAEFVNFYREWPEKFLPWFDKRNQCVNLWALSKAQLIEAGLQEKNIYSLDLCTRLLADYGAFFSYRAGHSHRQVSLIWIAE